MEQEIINSFSKISSLNVSRETFLDLENYRSMLLKKNKEINLISQKTEQKKVFFDRHILDSAQIIDFIDLNID
ncbi:class I SAM-dependent methyltransferase, partial [Candidatus Pelagibacter sp.]|nr:class I SAM-dependent methyltransferase [Candidatus Pelagibacter sp.]